MRRVLGRLRGGGLVNDSVWGLALEGVTAVSMALTFVLLGRTLGPEGYGPYVAIYAVAGPLVTFAGGGAVLALLQHLVRDREDLPTASRSCLSLTLLIGVTLGVIGLAIALLIVEGLAVVAMISVLLSEFVCVPVIMLASAVVQARERYAVAARIRMLTYVTRIVVVLVLFGLSALTIVNLTVVTLVVAVVLAVGTTRHVGRMYEFPFTPGPMHWRHLKTNVYYSIGILGATVNDDGDKAVLSAYNFNRDLGLYGAAYRILRFAQLPVGTLVAATHRHFLEHDEGVQGQHLRRAIRFTRLGGLAGLVMSVGLFVSAPILPFILGDDFKESVTIVRWLAPLPLIRSLTMFAFNALMGLGHALVRSLLFLANGAMAVVLYVILVPSRGWKGAAVGTLISEGIEFFATWGCLYWLQKRDDRAYESAMAKADADGTGDASATSQHLSDGEADLWVLPTDQP